MTRPRIDKPPYAVPSMEAIRALPDNGLRVITTFAGGGGSSTGYRMAGYHVAIANEFIDAARDTYRANASPDTFIDPRDIRIVKGSEWLDRLGIARGELDLFDGSPPCTSFSMSGARQKNWGKVTKYSDTTQRSDDLFFEYVRLVDELQPRVFIAENVKGLSVGKAKGYFIRIIDGLKACGYRVKCQLMDAQWMGVPQARERLIFVGVRNDFGIEPSFPLPLDYSYSIRDALPMLCNAGQLGEVVRITIGNPAHKQKRGSSFPRGVRVCLDRPSPTIQATSTGIGGGSVVMTTSRSAGSTDTGRRKFSIVEIKRLCGFPDDYIVTGSYAKQWERLGNAVPPVMMYHIAAHVRDHIFTKLPQ